MPRATRVVLAPDGDWDEARLLMAARQLELPSIPLLPGDDVDGFLVVGVEPAAAAMPDASTALDIDTQWNVQDTDLHSLAILLDSTQSMRQPWGMHLTRLDAARHALGVFLPQSTHVARDVTLYAYGRDVRALAGPAPGDTLARPAASHLPASGSSRTGGALNVALARLLARPGARRAVLLLTDGAGDARELAAAQARLVRAGVPVHVLAFAPDPDPYLEVLAKATGGVHAIAKAPPSLAFALEALAKASGVTARWREPALPRPGEAAFDALTNDASAKSSETTK